MHNTIVQKPPTKSRTHGLLWAVAVILILFLGAENYYLYKVLHLNPSRIVVDLPRLIILPKSPQVTPLHENNSSTGVMAPLNATTLKEDFDRFHQQMDQLFNNTFGQLPLVGSLNGAAEFNSPNLDLREEIDRYVLTVDMPGTDKSTIKVTVDGLLLTISGRRETANETKEGGTVIRSERSLAAFTRTLELPGPVKADAIEAKYDNGVLTVNLPKSDQGSVPTQVPVQ